MNADQKAAILFNLDTCESLFKTLAHSLENNAGSDSHSLAMLATLGAREVGTVFDSIDRAGLV